MSEGWIRLHRASLDCPELSDPMALAIWATILLRAAHRPTRIGWRGTRQELDRGQLLISVREFSERTGVPYQKTRTVLKKFTDSGMLKINAATNAAGSLLTVCNYSRFQADDDAPNAASNAALTQEQRSSNAQNKNERIKEEESKKDLFQTESEIEPLSAPTAPTPGQCQAKSPSEPKATRLPAGWAPSHELIAYARGKGLTPADIDEEAEAFRNYWAAAPGAQGRKADWPATWRNWCIRAGRRLSATRPQSGSHPRASPPIDPRLAARLAEAKARNAARASAEAAGLTEQDEEYDRHVSALMMEWYNNEQRRSA